MRAHLRRWHDAVALHAAAEGLSKPPPHKLQGGTQASTEHRLQGVMNRVVIGTHSDVHRLGRAGRRSAAVAVRSSHSQLPKQSKPLEVPGHNVLRRPYDDHDPGTQPSIGRCGGPPPDGRPRAGLQAQAAQALGPRAAQAQNHNGLSSSISRHSILSTTSRRRPVRTPCRASTHYRQGAAGPGAPQALTFTMSTAVCRLCASPATVTLVGSVDWSIWIMAPVKACAARAGQAREVGLGFQAVFTSGLRPVKARTSRSPCLGGPRACSAFIVSPFLPITRPIIVRGHSTTSACCSARPAIGNSRGAVSAILGTASIMIGWPFISAARLSSVGDLYKQEESAQPRSVLALPPLPFFMPQEFFWVDG